MSLGNAGGICGTDVCGAGVVEGVGGNAGPGVGASASFALLSDVGGAGTEGAGTEGAGTEGPGTNDDGTDGGASGVVVMGGAETSFFNGTLGTFEGLKFGGGGNLVLGASGGATPGATPVGPCPGPCAPGPCGPCPAPGPGPTPG